MAEKPEFESILLQQALGDGHRKYGPVKPRKEDGESGGGTSGLDVDNISYLQAHPLLANAAQFSGDFNMDSPLPAENPEGDKQYKLELSAKLEQKNEKKLSNSSAPKLKLG